MSHFESHVYIWRDWNPLCVEKKNEILKRIGPTNKNHVDTIYRLYILKWYYGKNGASSMYCKYIKKYLCLVPLTVIPSDQMMYNHKYWIESTLVYFEQKKTEREREVITSKTESSSVWIIEYICWTIRITLHSRERPNAWGTHHMVSLLL